MRGLMFGKKRCYLCGGKLINGRCQECGLDNEKSAGKTYRLNESSGMQEEWIRGEQKKKPGIVLLTVLVGILAVTVGIAGLIGYQIKKEQDQVIVPPGKEYDEYGYVTRELSQTGDPYDNSLTGGYYEVGVQIPEGIYTVEAKEGEGAVYLNDDENGIYIFQQMGIHTANPSQLSVLEDLRLYDGALLEVKSGVSLRFISDCAQTEELHGQENPQKESIRLEMGQTLTAGKDFPEGVYHLKSDPDWNDLVMTLPKKYLAEYVQTGEERQEIIHFTPDPLEQSYANVPIPKGAKVRTTGAGLTLEPASQIGSSDYGKFYQVR